VKRDERGEAARADVQLTRRRVFREMDTGFAARLRAKTSSAAG